MIFNRGEIVTFTLGGHTLSGSVNGHLLNNDLVEVSIEGDIVAVPAAKLSRVGAGYQIGQIIEHNLCKYRVLEVKPVMLKVRVISVRGRPAGGGMVERYIRRDSLQYAEVTNP